MSTVTTDEARYQKRQAKPKMIFYKILFHCLTHQENIGAKFLKI